MISKAGSRSGIISYRTGSTTLYVREPEMVIFSCHMVGKEVEVRFVILYMLDPTPNQQFRNRPTQK
jgi:hypothetical protein